MVTRRASPGLLERHLLRDDAPHVRDVGRRCPRRSPV